MHSGKVVKLETEFIETALVKISSLLQVRDACGGISGSCIRALVFELRPLSMCTDENPGCRLDSETLVRISLLEISPTLDKLKC